MTQRNTPMILPRLTNSPVAAGQLLSTNALRMHPPAVNSRRARSRRLLASVPKGERGQFLLLTTRFDLCILSRMARKLRVEYAGAIYHPPSL